MPVEEDCRCAFRARDLSEDDGGGVRELERVELDAEIAKVLDDRVARLDQRRPRVLGKPEGRDRRDRDEPRELLLQLRHQGRDALARRGTHAATHNALCRECRIGYGRRVSAPEIRRYGVQARSTDTFGRVHWSCREQHFVADGPVQNGCPGEAVTPAELFLAGVATCGVELLQVIARSNDVPLENVDVQISGELDPANPVREDVNVFNSVRLAFELTGPTREQGEELVESFKRR